METCETVNGVTAHIGSKWAGEESDSLDDLIAMLEKEVLDASFYEFGNFFYTEDGKEFCAFGNFYHRSYGFLIRGPLDVLLPLAKALKRARRRPEYLREWASRYRKPNTTGKPK